MIYNRLPLNDAYEIRPEKIDDERGFFSRYFCKDDFKENGLNYNVNQINNSYNLKKGTLRGLHFQYSPKGEVKIIRCINGSIWDVMVDVRLNSSTYGKWYGKELNDENRLMLYIPCGFAHGFISLTDHTEIIYLSNQNFSPNHEGGLHWNDSFHNIHWPMDPTIISNKDDNIEEWSDIRAYV
jgi:dTDP-4-dehydrorhamnose 3,5-epimerase